MNNPLVSIIIPTYNRAHLIDETLQSIVRQTYQDWECLVVDDGSTDKTNLILKGWMQKDSRIHYCKRTPNKLKGGNACRNYGLELSKGDYILFFDSDDIMFPNKLELGLSGFDKADIDYVITKTIDFYHPNKKKLFNANPKNYNFTNYKLTHFNYVCQNINWLTPDALIKAEVAKQIRFNETLSRGQEYNFYVKLTLISSKGLFINEFTTKRRLHDDSIRKQFNQIEIEKQVVYLRLETLKEVYNKTSKEVKLWYIANIAKNITRTSIVLKIKDEVFLLSHISKYFGLRCVLLFVLSRGAMLVFKRNEFLRKRLKAKLA
jgi:glycosyltransferase involved in cell wall biosynthesis